MELYQNTELPPNYSTDQRTVLGSQSQLKVYVCIRAENAVQQKFDL